MLIIFRRNCAASASLGLFWKFGTRFYNFLLSGHFEKEHLSYIYTEKWAKLDLRATKRASQVTMEMVSFVFLVAQRLDGREHK